MPEPFKSTKEVAAILGVHVRTLNRMCKRLHVEPSISGASWHRWSSEDVERLIAALRAEANAKTKTDHRYVLPETSSATA